MKIFATRARRPAAAVPGASGPQPAVRSGLPHRFEAVGEALASGTDVLRACGVAGQDLARDGASVEETLEGLRVTWRGLAGTDPSYDAVATVLTAWSETTLGYLHQLSCEDPLTGLSSQAHLRSRLTELDRLGGAAGGTGDHALVVVAVPLGEPSEEPGDHFTRAMRLARAGELARTAFVRDETVARLGMHRFAILTRRDERLGRRVRVLRTLLDGVDAGSGLSARVWIEGLPPTDAGAGALLDELARG